MMEEIKRYLEGKKKIDDILAQDFGKKDKFIIEVLHDDYDRQ